MRGEIRNRELERAVGVIAVGLLAVLYPFHFYVSGIVPINASYGDLLIGLVGVGWLLGLVGVRLLPRFTYPLAAFVTVAALSMLVALASGASYLVPEHSVVVFLKLFGAIAWFVGTFVLCSRETTRRTKVLALVSVLIASAFAVATIQAGLEDGVLRPTGPFENPNIYANYLVLNGFLAAYLVASLSTDRQLLRTVASLTIPVLAAGLVVTASRGSILGAIAGVCAVPVLYPTRNNLRSILSPVFVLPVALTGTAAYAVLSTNDWIKERVLSTFEPDPKNLDTRIRRWEKGVDGFQENPILGVGFGQSQNYVREAGFSGDYPRLHNTHLTILSETGVVGALAFYLLFATVVFECFRLARDHEPAAAFLGSFVVAIMAEGLVTGVQTFRSLWLVLGLVAALSWHHYGEALDVRDVPDDVEDAIAFVSGSLQRIRPS